MNTNQANDGGKTFQKRLLLLPILGVAILLAVFIGLFVARRDQVTAISMRLYRMVGTVGLYDESGEEKTMLEDMQLYSGNSLTTAEESLVMVALDTTKLLTLEEKSRAEVKAEGRALKFDLTEGDMFFNVTEKLDEGETFDIEVSNMLCGVRGTSAYVGHDSLGHDEIMVTDGTVVVTGTNPVTGEVVKETVTAGEMLLLYLDDEAVKGTISFSKRRFQEEDLPALALESMAKNRELLARIYDATGFSTEKIEALAKVMSVPGESMVGRAKEEQASEGIADSIPLMGEKSDAITVVANRASDVAGENLSLEIAIITGVRDVMDVAVEAGYTGDDLSDVVERATDCMANVVASAQGAGVSGDDLVAVTASAAEALTSAVSEMTSSNLTVAELSDVIRAIGTVYTEAIAAASGDASGILAAVEDASSYVRETVRAEMLTESTGDETVVALLGAAGTETAFLEESAEGAAREDVAAPNRRANVSDETTTAEEDGTASAANTQEDTTSDEEASDDDAGASPADDASDSSERTTDTSSTSDDSTSTSTENTNTDFANLIAALMNTTATGTGGSTSAPASGSGSASTPPAGNTSEDGGDNASGSTGGDNGGNASDPSGGTSDPGEPEYQVTITPNDEITITSDKSMAKAKDTVTLTFTMAAGKMLDKLLLNDAEDNQWRNATDGINGSTYAFTMPAADLTVTATVKNASAYQILVPDGSSYYVNGSTTTTTKDSPASVLPGETVTVSQYSRNTSSYKYIVSATRKDNSKAIPAVDVANNDSSTIQFLMPASDVTLNSKQYHKVQNTISSMPNGESNGGITTLDREDGFYTYGEDITFTMQPAANFVIQSASYEIDGSDPSDITNLIQMAEDGSGTCTVNGGSYILIQEIETVYHLPQYLIKYEVKDSSGKDVTVEVCGSTRLYNSDSDFTRGGGSYVKTGQKFGIELDKYATIKSVVYYIESGDKKGSPIVGNTITAPGKDNNNLDVIVWTSDAIPLSLFDRSVYDFLGTNYIHVDITLE